MSKELDDWLRKSEGDLRLAKLAYDGKEYWGAISHLQEADEKIGKATLIQLGLLTSDQGMKNIMETFFGAKHTEPKDLGHDWGAQMVKDLEPFLDSLEKMVRPMGKSDSLRQAADWWKTSLPDYRERLEKAKQLKSNPLPSLTEFDGVIKDCNKILELSREVPSKI